MTLCGQIVRVGRRVVSVIESRDELEFHAAELPFEDTDFAPRMLRFVLRRHPPQIIPGTTQRFRPAHDFEVKEIGRHDVAMLVE